MRVLFLLIVLALGGCNAAAPYPIYGELQGPYPVEYVYDGDTIRVAGEKVRLLSIDTPESSVNDRTDSDDEVVYGRLAKEVTERLLAGREVWLELGTAERDRYGRLLAWVYLEDPDGPFEKDGRRYLQVNLELVRLGWAEPLIYSPNVRYENLIRAAYREAQAAGRGMWGMLAAREAPVRIVCVLYNPPGPDAGQEAVFLEVTAPVSLDGYAVGDDDGWRVELHGPAEPGEVRVAVEGRPELSNRGDTVILWYRGEVVDRFSYEGVKGQARACR